ncbi:hypothetical protein PBV52_25040 [Streptomyces sp. T12]|uniref:hypothetical protein n=1 Tax=Streptomyces sp. T12 TaxID=477697 RepID=UPI002366C573|nr:hypothetical protein [Streptomyces sp. T12]WDF39827.1 hypothetical protein PBV52_25040 [Streptomyces sp. T12]
MSQAQNPAADAAAALRTAERARAAAARPQSAPGWFPPLQGVLFAGFTIGMFGFSAPDDPADGLWGSVGGCLAAAAFVVLHLLVVRRSGVVLWPEQDRRARLKAQLVPLAVFAAGWLAALPGGRTVGAVVSGLLGAVALAVMTARYGAGAARGGRGAGASDE